MLTLTVHSIPVHKVIVDLAQCLNTPYEQNNNIFSLSIPEEIGSGKIWGIDFGQGFAMLNYDCTFSQEIRINFTFDQVHPMKFIHCRAGELLHLFEQKNQKHNIEKFENIIVASKKENGHILYFKKNIKTEICSIEIDRERFAAQVGTLKDHNPSTLLKVIKDNKAKRAFYTKNNYSIQIQNLIDSLLSNRSSEIVDQFHAKGVCYKMLALQWDQFYENQSKLDYNRKISASDFRKYTEIINYIQSNLNKDLSIKTIKKVFGINEKKLQFLFNKLNKTSYNSFLRNIRLERSLEFLKTSESNVSDVVYILGFKSKSYFSKIFKEKYGIPPSVYIKNIQKKR